jgi:ornithine lipid hydroxylase
MLAKTIARISNWWILPALFALAYAVYVGTHALGIEKWVTLAFIGIMIVLERVYHYRYAVAQKSLLLRDMTSTAVNLFVTSAVVGFLVVPVLVFLPEHLLGRKLVFASPEQLGPLWLQIPIIMLFVSFFRYWMHRFQHKNEFLWRLHSYHHQVSDLQARNVLVSHPIDFALRNVLVFFILGVIGFSPLAIVLSVPAVQVSGLFSHWGGDVKGGVLNYFFVTSEVHRWHHSATVPEGHRYSVNYGVEYSFWDILFGTFYLPQTAEGPAQPVRLGHPNGYVDEPNYLKLLLVPLRLYPPDWFKRAQQPAE